jgi:hypothetical protein
MTSVCDLALGGRITSGTFLRNDGGRLIAHHLIAQSIKKLP